MKNSVILTAVLFLSTPLVNAIDDKTRTRNFWTGFGIGLVHGVVEQTLGDKPSFGQGLSVHMIGRAATINLCKDSTLFSDANSTKWGLGLGETLGSSVRVQRNSESSQLTVGFTLNLSPYLVQAAWVPVWDYLRGYKPIKKLEDNFTSFGDEVTRDLRNDVTQYVNTSCNNVSGSIDWLRSQYRAGREKSLREQREAQERQARAAKK